MNRYESDALDNHITGNYGEDYFQDETDAAEAPLISVRAWETGAQHAADGWDCAHQIEAMAPVIVAQALRDLAGTLKCNTDIARAYARANELDPGETT